MAVKVTLTGTSGSIGEVIEYSVSEDATPLVIGDSSGSVGKIDVEAKAKTTGPVANRSGAVVGGGIILTDTREVEGTAVKGHGSIEGQITAASMPGQRVNFSADTILNRLNTDRKADPYYGSYVPAQTSTTVRTNIRTNPSRETNVTGLTVDLGPGSLGGAATIAQATETDYPGNFARLTYTSNGTGVGGGFYERVDVVGGSSYTLSGQYRVTRAAAMANGAIAQQMRFVMRYFNASNVALNDTFVNTAVIQGQWTPVSIASVAPAAATYAHIFVVANGTGGTLWKINDKIDSDYIIVQAGGGGGYFDGSTPTSDVTDPHTGIRTVKTYAWTGTAHASSSTETTAVTLPAYGYDATQANAFRYYCSLVDINNVVIDPEFEERPVAYPGWEGNVWTHLKAFAAAIRAEIALVDGTVALRKPRTVQVPMESISGPVLTVDSTNAAQYVEVINQNSRWGNNETALTATTVYSVESNGYTEVEISVPHFLGRVNTPEAVATYAIDYEAGLGQYTVLDSQGLVVAPAWWKANGGRVTVSLAHESFNDLIIGIWGPRSDSKSYLGPFKLGRFITPSSADEQGEIGAALDITGSGVFINPQTVRIRTGLTDAQTSTVADSPIDNPFLSNADLAYTRGLDAACAAAGPMVRLTGTINNFTIAQQQFGMLAGGRIAYGGNIFRITNTVASRGGVQITALADMTFTDMIDLYSYSFSEFNDELPGLTMTGFNGIFSTYDFQEFNESIGTPVFGDFNVVYEEATFNDHAIYPYLAEAPVEETATF